ncbi:hypothetical protein [Neptunicella sp.]|uniref:hypothetical protein n=1 Tax=Neptunicella sp. TaxID=2125986 RepID=UPI003F693FEA
MATVKIKQVSLQRCSIHPDAKRAFAFTSALTFQLEATWSKALSLSQVSPPWALLEPISRSYLIFNQWKPLLHHRKGDETVLKIVHWGTPECDIEELAWRYAADLFDSSLHRDSVLTKLAHFIDVVPEPVYSKLRVLKKSRSLETLCRFYADEPRAPVRTKVEAYAKIRAGK